MCARGSSIAPEVGPANVNKASGELAVNRRERVCQFSATELIKVSEILPKVTVTAISGASSDCIRSKVSMYSVPGSKPVTVVLMLPPSPGPRM
jgi:hypothetical protein